jgi:hypothetical protein
VFPLQVYDSLEYLSSRRQRYPPIPSTSLIGRTTRPFRMMVCDTTIIRNDGGDSTGMGSGLSNCTSESLRSMLCLGIFTKNHILRRVIGRRQPSRTFRCHRRLLARAASHLVQTARASRGGRGIGIDGASLQ